MPFPVVAVTFYVAGHLIAHSPIRACSRCPTVQTLLLLITLLVTLLLLNLHLQVVDLRFVGGTFPLIYSYVGVWCCWWCVPRTLGDLYPDGVVVVTHAVFPERYDCRHVVG